LGGGLCNSIDIKHLLIYWEKQNKEKIQHEIRNHGRHNKLSTFQTIDVSESKLLIQSLEKLRSAFPNYQLTLLTTLDDSLDENLVVQNVSNATWTFHQTVDWLRQHSFDAALIFTPPTRSPYAMAYACYLAGIPIRLGQSCEFSGGILSTCIAPCDTHSIADSYRHLLHSSIPILCGSES
jgi:hypothetical protein